jgi:preprotein translocase subunit SecE
LSASAAALTTQDRFKLIAAGVVALAGVVGFYFLANSPVVARLGVLLAAVVIALGIGWTSKPGKDFVQYCQDSTTETKKVVWPSRKETMQTTGVVVAFVLIMALFLWIVDASLVWVVRILIGREA